MADKDSKRIKENEKNETSGKKKCFVITPIGGDGTDIRRQIDGVIDGCIIPAIGDEYEVVVAHRICATGSINNQVISEIYHDELVIANLTGLNPNVMYELAFRHALRKPVIVIKNNDDGSKLPFDITEDRTIFYTNDISGTSELKESLKKFVEEIDFNKEADNPITRGIRHYKAVKDLEKTENDDASISNGTAKLLLERFENLERIINSNSCNNSSVINSKNDDMIRRITENIRRIEFLISKLIVEEDDEVRNEILELIGDTLYYINISDLNWKRKLDFNEKLENLRKAALNITTTK